MTFRLKSALKSLSLVLMSIGLAACSAAHVPASVSSSNNGTAATSAYNLASGTAAAEYLDEVVFPKDKVIDVKITIDPDDFQDMLDNASAEEYKPASVNYNGQQIDNIGIRTKGNLSLRSVVQMSDSDRYSFKLSFNEYVNQTLGGLEKINLNNNYSDASSMREYLAYELAETMGLPTPKYSFVNIYINDELWGFYLAMEQIGTAYLERHFDHAYGALYKGVMTGSGSDLIWLGDDPDLYTGLELKSKSENGNVLTDMLDELNHGTDYESVIFVEEALKYIALNVVTNNTDSYIGGNKQNYYLYEEDGVFSILPWDYNMAFGGLGGGMGMGRGGMSGGRGGTAGGIEQGGLWLNPIAGNGTENDLDGSTGKDTGNNPAAPSQFQTSEAEERSEINGDPAANAIPGHSGTALLIDEPTQGALADRPLVAKLLAVDAYKKKYHDIIKEAIGGYLSEDSFSARVEQLKQLISEYVEQDPNAFYTYEEYLQGVTDLMATNAKQVDNIAQQLAGTLPSSGDGSGSGGGMGGGIGGRFGAGAAPDIRNHVDAPAAVGEQSAAAGQQDAGVARNKQGAKTQQGAAAGPESQGALNQQQGADRVQAGQSALTQAPIPSQNGQGANRAESEHEAPAQQGTAPSFGNPETAAPDGQAPQEGFQGGRRSPDGMGFSPPEGFGNPGEFGWAGQQSQQQGSTTTEAITAGLSLLVLLAACAFVFYFRRKRL